MQNDAFQRLKWNASEHVCAAHKKKNEDLKKAMYNTAQQSRVE